MTHSPTDLAVWALAVYRVTTLIVDDSILSAPRSWVVKKSEWGMQLITCPWCVSFWIAIVAVVMTAQWRDSWYGAVVLAFSAVAGLLSTAARR